MSTIRADEMSMEDRWEIRPTKMANIKVRKTVWHECEESTFEDPDKDDTGCYLTRSNHTGRWYLTADCHDGLLVHFCPGCGDVLPVDFTRDNKKDV